MEGVKKISIGIEPKNYWEKIQGIIGIPSRPLTLLRKKDPKTKLDSAGKVSGLVQEYFNISIFQYFKISSRNVICESGSAELNISCISLERPSIG